MANAGRNWVGVAAAGAIVLAAGMSSPGRAAQAVEIKVLSANGVKTIVGDLIPRFESTSGAKVTVSFGEAGELRRRILEGDAFDVAFLPAGVLQDLAKQGKIAADTMVDVARTAVGMGVRVGAAKPDTSSTEGFKRSLLAMRSIVITDPATGGVTGVHFASVLQHLGIADEVTPKLKLTRGVLNAEIVARGEADLAIQLAHEIRAVAGVEFVPLPPQFQRSIVFSLGLAVRNGEPQAAKELIAFLSGPAAAPTITAKGMEPAASK
jgi:molybdate transport system substrate-binding protein